MSGPSSNRHRQTPAIAASLLLLALTSAGPAALRADEGSDLRDAIADGKVTLDLRYRFEQVADDSPEDDARASTLRTALGYRTRAYKGFSFLIEAENVTAVGNDLYDNSGWQSLRNGMTDRSVVADPAVTEINQALLRYRGDRWLVAVGRQELVLGDARFVGNVGWRQNHQSFDAVRVDNFSLGGLRFTYAFVDKVHRVTGESRDLAGHLLNAGFELQNAGKFTLYGYLVDYEDRGLARLSTATWGLRFAGKRRLVGDRALLYEVELAEQTDYADNPSEVDVGYLSLMLGLALPKVNVKLAHESLEGGPDGQFATPLATLHDFNGWADKFLTTPLFGLEDTYLQLDGEIGDAGWLVRYHDFAAEARSLSYGRELDLQLTWTCARGILLGLKGALYDADGHSFDTDKWMVWASYRL